MFSISIEPTEYIKKATGIVPEEWKEVEPLKRWHGVNWCYDNVTNESSALVILDQFIVEVHFSHHQEERYVQIARYEINLEEEPHQNAVYVNPKSVEAPL